MSKRNNDTIAFLRSTENIRNLTSITQRTVCLKTTQSRIRKLHVRPIPPASLWRFHCRCISSDEWSAAAYFPNTHQTPASCRKVARWLDRKHLARHIRWEPQKSLSDRPTPRMQRKGQVPFAWTVVRTAWRVGFRWYSLGDCWRWVRERLSRDESRVGAWNTGLVCRKRGCLLFQAVRCIQKRDWNSID